MGKHTSPRKMITITEELEALVEKYAKSERRPWARMAVILIIEALEDRGEKITQD
ncbi:MAG: hypothetical protein AAF208_06755 [Cyanobacteria bacterium P01_A01_bin.45]